MNTETNEVTIDEFKYDVVIPHLNCDKLRKCLESLRKYGGEKQLGKVILIDQNKEYQDVDEYVDFHVRVKSNLGFSGAVNRGILLSRAPYVLVLNDDTEFVHERWLPELVNIFNKYGKRALGVNGSSTRNPRASGAEPIDHVDFPYHSDWSDEEYEKYVKEIGRGYCIDGICTWGTMFNRSKLEKVESTIPGKCYFNEICVSGAQDYMLSYNSYLTKNEDNDYQGYRMLGAGDSLIYHWWYSTKNEAGEEKVKYDGSWIEIFGLWENGELVEAPDIFGQKGIKKIVKNIIREDD